MNNNTVEQKTSELTEHYPVMLSETLAMLNVQDSKNYLDCTFGGGGHSRAILKKADCKLVAIDQDIDAIARAKDFEKEFQGRFTFYPINFSKLGETQTGRFAGVVMDLGVSSFQLNEAERGFSFMREGPTDMRMNRNQKLSALDIVETFSLDELTRILREYGEEPRAYQVAKAIIAARGKHAMDNTLDLAKIISSAADKSKRINPATKSFQGLRIAVNDELKVLEESLPKIFDKLESKGKLAVITFHSLEDRIVKRFFRKMCAMPLDAHDSTAQQNRIKLAELETRKPIAASESEINENPRSRSAKLRALTKL